MISPVHLSSTFGRRIPSHLEKLLCQCLACSTVVWGCPRNLSAIWIILLLISFNNFPEALFKPSSVSICSPGMSSIPIGSRNDRPLSCIPLLLASSSNLARIWLLCITVVSNVLSNSSVIVSQKLSWSLEDCFICWLVSCKPPFTTMLSMWLVSLPYCDNLGSLYFSGSALEMVEYAMSGLSLCSMRVIIVEI